MEFINELHRFKLLKKQVSTEDFSDVLCYQWTTAFFMICVVITGMKQYILKPIQCWVPQEWSGAWEEYTENYCWVENTYYSDGKISGIFPVTARERDEAKISYYQWVPFFLTFQATLFYLPHVVWKITSKVIGYNVNEIVKFASDADQLMDDVKKQKLLKNIASHLVKTMRRRKERQRNVRHWGSWWSKSSNNLLIIIYFLKKIMHVINAIGQLFLMQCYLGFNSVFFGWNVLKSLAIGNTWQTSSLFPRVNFCDVKIFDIGQAYMRTIQCVLPTNMLNEKIYIFLWFWIVFTLVVAIISLAAWNLTIMCYNSEKSLNKYRKKLNINQIYDKEKSITQFIQHFIGRDGIFLMYMIEKNVGELAASQILNKTFELWINDNRLSPLNYNIEESPIDDISHDYHVNIAHRV